MSSTIGFRRLNLWGVRWRLVNNAAGVWELAMKTNVSQNRCRVFRKSPWWDLSCDDDVWLHEQATMNRAQNSFVDEQLEQIQSAHDELRCYFADYKTSKYDQQRHAICLIKADALPYGAQFGKPQGNELRPSVSSWCT